MEKAGSCNPEQITSTLPKDENNEGNQLLIPVLQEKGPLGRPRARWMWWRSPRIMKRPEVYLLLSLSVSSYQLQTWWCLIAFALTEFYITVCVWWQSNSLPGAMLNLALSPLNVKHFIKRNSLFSSGLLLHARTYLRYCRFFCRPPQQSEYWKKARWIFCWPGTSGVTPLSAGIGSQSFSDFPPTRGGMPTRSIFLQLHLCS